MLISIKSFSRSFFLKIVVLFVSLMSLLSCQTSLKPIAVEIKNIDGKYQLFRGGKPYKVKGAGIEVSDFEAFARHGGNSIRNWTTTNPKESTLSILNKAHELGLTVSLCLSLGKEHWGFDYDNDEAVKKQFEAMREEVLKYRNHPALLTWIIGNELNFEYKNPKVYDAVNDIAKMIHELDPLHPTTTTVAGLGANVVKDIQERAPAIDFISFQVYGQMAILPETIQAMNYTGPLMVTEWGTVGFWEVPKTSWGAPIEMNSSQKANNYLRSYEEKLAAVDSQLIGDYVFLWGQKQERTSTWFGMFTEFGQETESIDVMHYAWNKQWPTNRSPLLHQMTLNKQMASDDIILSAGQTYQALVESTDPDNDALTYLWELKPESDSQKVGGDFEESIANLRGNILTKHQSEITIKAPKAPGAYRLFVYVFDDHNHAAHANIPFLVKN